MKPLTGLRAGVGMAGAFLAGIAALAGFGVITRELLYLYLLTSLLTFIMYAWDKSAARKGRWRTSEKTLQLLSLVGGWPGALIAQRMLRHKSSKKEFLIVFWLSVVANCALLIWWIWR